MYCSQRKSIDAVITTHLEWELEWGRRTCRQGTAGRSESSTPCPCPRRGRQGMWAAGWCQGPLGCCLGPLWCCRWGWAACKATMWWAQQWWCWESAVCCLGPLWCCRSGWAACKATMWWALQWWCWESAVCCRGLLWCCRWGWAACKATMWWAQQWWCQRGTLHGQQRRSAQAETKA